MQNRPKAYQQESSPRRIRVIRAPDRAELRWRRVTFLTVPMLFVFPILYLVALFGVLLITPMLSWLYTLIAILVSGYFSYFLLFHLSNCLFPIAALVVEREQLFVEYRSFVTLRPRVWKLAEINSVAIQKASIQWIKHGLVTYFIAITLCDGSQTCLLRVEKEREAQSVAAFLMHELTHIP